MQALELQREAEHSLPAVMAELLDLSTEDVELKTEPLKGPDRGIDAILSTDDRTWFVQMKTSSSPGAIARAAEQARRYLDSRPIEEFSLLLVVPYMSEAGAKAAEERDLDWVDLSGNAHLRNEGLYVRVEGRPSRFPARGRPSTPFAPKSARVSRVLLLDPWRWWRQRDLAGATGLDDGSVSRVVRRLDDDGLLAYDGPEFRPRDPNLHLDAWADDYRFDRHYVLAGHHTGSGADLAKTLHAKLAGAEVDHAFTGLPAAWALGKHARFRLVSVYVKENPLDVADAAGIRREAKGANVQLIAPDDDGVFDGVRAADNYPCVSPVQAYLDLLHLPERAREAADQLRSAGLLWPIAHD